MLPRPETGPVCPDSVEFMLDADGVQFAIESGALSCEGERTTVSFEDFEGVVLGDSAEWATSGDSERSSEIVSWPDGFDTNTCPDDGSSFVQFKDKGDGRLLFYNGVFDATGLTALRLSFVTASRDGTSVLDIRGCCGDDCTAGDFKPNESGLEVSTSGYTPQTEGLPQELFGCSELEIVFSKSFADAAVLAIDDISIFGTPEVLDFSETSSGEYTFDLQACVPGEYSVTCMYEDDGVSLDSTSSVELVSE